MNEDKNSNVYEQSNEQEDQYDNDDDILYDQRV